MSIIDDLMAQVRDGSASRDDAVRTLAEGYGLPEESARGIIDWRQNGGPRVSKPVDWSTVEISVVDLTPRSPLLYPTPPRLAIAPQTMQRVAEAATEHPRFRAPAISISFAPAGTDPRDDGSYLPLDSYFDRFWLNRPVVATETAVERPTIRMVGDRRMQCKDIPDEDFLDAVRLSRAAGHGGGRGNVRDLLEQQHGNIPENLILAKARRLIDRKLIDGCGCGCRGDFEVLP